MYHAIGRRMTTSAKKISNRERQRLAQLAVLQYEHQRLIMLGILGSLGGEVIVTEAALAQINKYGEDVDYAVVDGEKPGESIVRLVIGKDIQDPAVAEDIDKGIPAGATDAEAIS
jgi:hypothetical protein